MKDFPLRAWVLNGSQEYKIKQTKVHGDVRAVNVTLQGENKVHLLFTVLSTDQRSNYNCSLILQILFDIKENTCIIQHDIHHLFFFRFWKEP